MRKCVYQGKFEISLLSVAPELKDRIILMRSATKALSAAGERMAVVIAFNDSFMTDLVQVNVNINGHAPRSLQYVFAEAMENLDHIELENLRKFYGPQVEYAFNRVAKMGAALPKSELYRPEGSFYVIADLKDLFGQEMSAETARALDKTGKISTDEELIYSLLFDNGVSIAPLSYFGLSKYLGYVRITCSGGEQELEQLMNRLENRLLIARKEKQMQLINQFNHLTMLLGQFDKFNKGKIAEIRESISKILQYQSVGKNITAWTLKQSNQLLAEEIHKTKQLLDAHLPSSKAEVEAVPNMQSFFRSREQVKKLRDDDDVEGLWRKCVDIYFTKPETRQELYQWPAPKRSLFLPWPVYLRENNLSSDVAMPQAKL